MDLLACILTLFHTIFMTTANQWNIITDECTNSFTAELNGVLVMQHSEMSPLLFIGSGQTNFKEHHGNFAIDDYIVQRVALKRVKKISETQVSFTAMTNDAIVLNLTFGEGDPLCKVDFSDMSAGYDRMWMRFHAQPEDKVYGGGEQFTYLNMRNHSFPIWTREQGVGRNKSSQLTFDADTQAGGAGGDYHTTYYGEPTFFSTAGYMVHSTSFVYSILDFRAESYHEIEIHGNASKILITAKSGASIKDLSLKYIEHAGKQPALPDWMFSGAIIGVQGGTNKMLEYVKQAEDHNVKVSAMWIQDWAGKIKTTFGQRVFWNWEWNSEWYPGLDKEISKLKAKGIQVLVYINPYLNVKGNLFKEADSKGLFVKNSKGQTHVADFGEFFCGTVDFTNPAAVAWYKQRIIGRAIQLGISGWMADFSEYLPVDDVVFHSGESAASLHNKWPVLWAKVNRDAVEEANKLGEVVFWMRAGYAGISKYGLLHWAGDQMVDYTVSDGFASTVTSALSMGLQGTGITHYDIGGYSSLYGIKRTKDLLLRSAEAAVFTPVMRTHEGNRPLDNWQVYADDNTWNQFARLTTMYTKMKNYTKQSIEKYLQSGIPPQRPLFYDHPDDERSTATEHQYMYGDDLLVAPILQPNVTEWTVYLPPGNWVHLWSENPYTGGQYVKVAAPMGEPPVFYKADSAYDWASIRIPRVPDVMNPIDPDVFG